MKTTVGNIITVALLLFTLVCDLTAEPQDQVLRVNVDSSRDWKKHHFAMTNWFYKYKWDKPEEHIRILTEAGYQGAMLSLKDDPRRWKMLPAYLKALQKHKLKLTAIHCRFTIEDGTYPQFIKDNLPLLENSGVILVPSIVSRKKADRRDPKAVEMAVRILREMSDDATKHKLGGVAPYMHINNWLETVDDGIFIAEKVKRKNVGVMFHLHHWTAVEQRKHKTGAHANPFQVNQKSLQASIKRAYPYLMIVVVQGQDKNAATHKILGEGDFDFQPLIRALNQMNYRGPLGTMGYTQSGDIPGKLAKAKKAWTHMRDKAVQQDLK